MEYINLYSTILLYTIIIYILPYQVQFSVSVSPHTWTFSQSSSGRVPPVRMPSIDSGAVSWSVPASPGSGEGKEIEIVSG